MFIRTHEYEVYKGKEGYTFRMRGPIYAVEQPMTPNELFELSQFLSSEVQKIYKQEEESRRNAQVSNVSEPTRNNVVPLVSTKSEKGN